MRRHFLLLVILFTLCVTAAQAQTNSESSPVSFSISSLKSPFALAGTFEGEYSLRDDSIDITLSSASIQLRRYGTYEGRRQLSFINVALASIGPSGRWTVIGHARAIPVGETLKPGDNYLTDEKMRFSIPRDSTVDLSKCWLVVEMGELTLDSDKEDKVGYAFAPSDHDIFSPVAVKVVKK